MTLTKEQVAAIEHAAATIFTKSEDLAAFTLATIAHAERRLDFVAKRDAEVRVA